MADALRLSPSGPDIQNPGGALFEPGAGARLRLAEATTTVGSTTNVITTIPQVLGVELAAAPVLGNAPMVASLLLPDEAKNYRATLCCDVMSDLTNADLTVTLTVQTSPDQITWTDLVSNEHTLGFNATATPSGGARSVRLDAVLRSGTAFNVTDGDAQLAVRGLVSASAAGGQVAHPTGSAETGVGSCYIILEEMF
jgi:hypothetical protein